MTRLSQLLHLDDGEFPALRAQIEAKPLPAPPAPKPANWGRDMLAFLRSQDVADAPVSLRYPAPVRIRPEALLTASAATVHTLAVAYDDLADEVETVLAELAALIPLALYGTKAQVA